MKDPCVCVYIYIQLTTSLNSIGIFGWHHRVCVCVCNPTISPSNFSGSIYLHTSTHIYKPENHQWNNPSRWHPTTSTLIDGHIKQEKRIKPEGIWNHRQRERRKGASQEERDGHQHGESLVMNEWRMRVPPRLNSSSRLYPQTRHDCIWDIWI